MHVSKGGLWDPLFPPTASHSSALHSVFTWLRARAGSVQAEAAPRWLYWTFSVALFAYQSLDAIDGKQARRTGTSGPVRCVAFASRDMLAAWPSLPDYKDARTDGEFSFHSSASSLTTAATR